MRYNVIKYDKISAGIKAIQSVRILDLNVAFLTYVATSAADKKLKGLVPSVKPKTTSLIIPAKKICPAPILSGDFRTQK